MPKEVITVQVGQCGNQIGMEFWKQLCAEHGIDKDGSALPTPEGGCHDRKDIFFYQADDNQYVPRSILLDLEPRVIDRIRNSEYGRLHNTENFFVAEHGSGAGNNWACGYNEAQTVQDTVMEKIEREAENSDSLEAFILCHSISGGTGAGMGSFVLEQLQDLYPKNLVLTYSVFPDIKGKEGGDVIVAPYNSLLTMKRLVQCVDAVVVLDNSALNRIVSGRLGVPSPTLEETNTLVSTVMAASTATVRFPGSMFNNLRSVVTSTCPSADCHFLVSGYTPLTVHRQENVIVKTSVYDVLRRLLRPENWMVSTSQHARDQSKSQYAGILSTIQGEVDLAEIYSSVNRLQEKKLVNMVPWGYGGIQVAHTRKSPYIQTGHRVNGLMLASYTGIRHLFNAQLQKFEKMFSKRVAVHNFQKYPKFENNLVEFEEAREAIQQLVEEYTACESPGFPTWVPGDPTPSPAVA